MEFCRALRGQRSQVAWSRRLGYRSNVAYSWEKGRRWPTAAEALRAAERNGTDLERAFESFFGRAVPGWVRSLNLTTNAAVSALLSEVKGAASIASLAEQSGLSRFAISRWLSGKTEPRLPDFFQLFEVSSTRLVDLLSVLVTPEMMPTVAEINRRAELRREGARRMPWTQAILRVLELQEYRAMPAHQPGWVAKRLGIDVAIEAEAFAFLTESAQVIWTGTHYVPGTIAVDTRGSPAIGRALKAHWSAEAIQRIQRGASGQFSYLVFSVSQADFDRIRDLHLRYFNSLRGIIAASEPSDCVAVANVQLFPLEPLDDR